MTLTYTVPQFAKEIGTDKNNVYTLIKLGYIKTLRFGRQSQKITLPEAQRFLDENRGTDFTKLINDYNKQKELKALQNQIFLEVAE